jgi:flavin-dependent dehydrogenase
MMRDSRCPPHASVADAAGSFLGLPIRATTTATHAACHPWHAIVVGAGPAGAATALRLARAGREVLLVERDAMPRPKVCGSCLSATAIDELLSLGFGTPRQDGAAWHPASSRAARENPVPLEVVGLARVRLVTRRATSTIPLHGTAVLSRESLDPTLVQAAIAAGCQWLPNTLVRSVTEPARHEPSGLCRVTVEPAEGPALRSPATTDGNPAARARILRAGSVILAAGLAEHVRVVRADGMPVPRDRRVAPSSRVGLGAVLPASTSWEFGNDSAELPSGELVMAVGPRGYCGVVRLEDGRLDVAAAVDRRLLTETGDPGRAMLRVLDEAGCDVRGPLADALVAGPCRATPPLTHRAGTTVGETGRIFRVGDAAAYVEPFTGEGIGWALMSARLLAATLMAVDGGECPDPARPYSRRHAAALDPRLARCRRIARALRHDAVVRGAAHAARALPWVARRALPLLLGGRAVEGATR